MINVEDLGNKITSNKIIMDIALEYTKEKKNRDKILNEIKHTRLRKKTYLPFKLLGLDGTI